MPNLTVLWAGVKPPNPAALLDSHRMTNMLQEFKEQYDFVILDNTNPQRVVPVAPHSGQRWQMGCSLVVRPGIANRQSAIYAKSLLQQSQQTVLGLVVNGVLSDFEPYGYYLSEEFFDEVIIDPDQDDNGQMEIEITSTQTRFR